MIPFSVLDLSLITDGGSAREALAHSRDLVRDAEMLGFRRYWVAEHHAMPGIASAATSVVIGHLAAATSTIRVGAGGIMLPNHPPLVIAEQFGTLDALFPGRIDLGLGRAPGSDPTTARALRRRAESADSFPQDVLELLQYFEPSRTGQPVVATPGAGADIQIWLLGSSLFSAHLAAQLGLPFAFASHFAPQQMEDAIDLYRSQFRPSETLAAPYLMLAGNVVIADTEPEARRLATSRQIYMASLRQGQARRFPAPVHPENLPWSQESGEQMDTVLSQTFVGEPTQVRDRIAAFLERHQPDEMLVTVPVYDHDARRHALRRLAEIIPTLPSRG